MEQSNFIFNRSAQPIFDKVGSNINNNNLSSIYNIIPLNGITKQTITNETNQNKLMIKSPKLPSYRKAMWTEIEDQLLLAAVKQHGTHNWGIVAASVAGRTRKQCRERWSGKLNPELAKDPWTDEEDKKLKELHNKFGNKWALIAVHLSGRSPIMLKNRWGYILRHSNQTKKGSKNNVNHTQIQSSTQPCSQDQTNEKKDELTVKEPNYANNQITQSQNKIISNAIIPSFYVNDQNKTSISNLPPSSNNLLPFSLGNQTYSFPLHHFS